jgi:hypothetical protein
MGLDGRYSNFNKIFTVNVIANGLAHKLDIKKATSARSVDAKIFKQEDARVWQILLERLSKRLIREVRSCKTVIEAIGWLRDKYGDWGRRNSTTSNSNRMRWTSEDGSTSAMPLL